MPIWIRMAIYSQSIRGAKADLKSRILDPKDYIEVRDNEGQLVYNQIMDWLWGSDYRYNEWG